MKSLKTMPIVAEALRKIATKSSVQHDNGTFGTTIKCYLWNVDEQASEEAQAVLKDIISKKYAGKDYSSDSLRMEKLKPSKAMLVFRLMEPMNIKGTKIAVFNGKNISPEVRACQELYIPQDIAEMEGLLSYTETGEKATNMQGQEVDVVNLVLNRCMVDVKEGMRDRMNPLKWVRAPRAYITDIPFRAFQLVSGMLRKEDYNRYKAYGMLSDEDIQAALTNDFQG